jgi:transcriptional regulator with XRE-family HTH domain
VLDTAAKAPTASSLGRIIRSLRLRKGLTLEELAQRSRLSAAMISKVESGQSSPSINSLRNISEALSVPVAYMFSEETAAVTDPVSFNHKQIYTYKNVTYTVVMSPRTTNAKLFLFEAQPGAERGSIRVPHFQHDGFEQGIVIEGQIEMTVGGSVYVLGRFDTISFSGLLQHGWVNRGPAVCRAVWSISFQDLPDQE